MVFCPEGKSGGAREAQALPPPGIYAVRIVAANSGLYDSGAGYIGVKFEFLNGPCKGKTFSEKMILWKCAAFGSALGLPKIEKGGKFGYDIQPTEIVGVQLEIETEIEEYLPADSPPGKAPIRSCRVVPFKIRALPQVTAAATTTESPF